VRHRVLVQRPDLLSRSPTATARRLNHPEEPTMTSTIKRAIVKVAVATGAVTAITTVVIVASRLETALTRRWS
jgi:hypothetical protein